MINWNGLNPYQREAIEILEGPALVLAGAGSGKTKVVTSRIVYLIQNGIPPTCILGVTFTNKAAEEMRQRVRKMINHEVFICTFHRLGARILRESIYTLGYSSDFTIYDEEDREKLIKICLIELNFKDQKLGLKSFRYRISQAKNALLHPDQIQNKHPNDEIDEIFPALYALYQKKLKEYQAVDFDDLLFLPVQLFHDHPALLTRYQERWPFVLIDEYQDTNEAQYHLTRLLVGERRNLFVVGDPDQSIYSWRGANIQNILKFEEDYPGAKVIRLEQNYRSQMPILEVANHLIRHNRGRYEKQLWSELKGTEKVQLVIAENEQKEASFVVSQIKIHHSQKKDPLNEIVIFYRTNAQSRVFEDLLIFHQIPYVIIGDISFYQRREIKDLLAFLRLLSSPTDYLSFMRTINVPKRGLGEATVEKIRHHANEEGLGILDYCKALIEERLLKNRIRLTSKQKQSLKDYLNLLDDLRDLSKKGSIHDLIIHTIEKTHYKNYLMEDKESYKERLENLDELISKAIEWETVSQNPSLENFLEEFSLKSTAEESGSKQDRINLMTIHNSKGLEFRTVFLVGLEEGLFPHVHSAGNREQVEEERRLCYVGITRAKQTLYLSYCQTRYLWGALQIQRPSRFLKEIPIHSLEQGFSSQQTVSYKKQLIPNQLTEFFIGDRIIHQDFGMGEIKEIYEGSLGLTYKILFDQGQTFKTLVAKYATLIKI